MNTARASFAPEDAPGLDRVAEALRADPGLIDRLVRKTERINILVTPLQKDEVVHAAGQYGLTITEYVTRVLAIVEKVRREAAEPARRRGGRSGDPDAD